MCQRLVRLAHSLTACGDKNKEPGGAGAQNLPNYSSHQRDLQSAAEKGRGENNSRASKQARSPGHMSGSQVLQTAPLGSTSKTPVNEGRQ